jgi:cytochrome b involved in lipid metabolism
MDRLYLVSFLLVAMLLAGCTINPQDTASNIASKSADSMNPGNSSAGTTASTTAVLTIEEVAKHNTKADCWMIIDNKVLDLSSYLSHPGGDAYVPYCGTDATVAFNDKGGRGKNHSATAFAMLDSFTIGELGGPRVR